MQAGDYDDEAFQPHADIDNNRNDPQNQGVGPDFLEPKKLRVNNVAENQTPVEDRIGPGHPVHYHVAFVGISAEVAEEGFNRVTIGNDQASSQGDFGHVVQVAHSNDVVQPIKLADRDHQGQNHAET